MRQLGATLLHSSTKPDAGQLRCQGHASVHCHIPRCYCCCNDCWCCSGVIWRGESVIDGVPETLDMLRAAVSTVPALAWQGAGWQGAGWQGAGWQGGGSIAMYGSIVAVARGCCDSAHVTCALYV
jgi:hypothetical protein